MMATRLDIFENRISSLLEDSVRKVVKEEIQSTNERSLDCCNRMRKLETAVNGLPSLLGDSVRKMVREEIQAASLDGGNWTNTNSAGQTLSTRRTLNLKFFGEPDDALTGKEIKGRGGGEIRVEIFDEVTGMVIESGPESSAKVEILILESENENEQNWSHEDFNSRIIMDNDKKRPHFAKPYHVYLVNGSGVLTNAKLANDKGWSRSCRCRLGARIVENLSGVIVKEAWSTTFEVSDSRGKLYAKRKTPSLSDKVWRLDSIGKDGEPCKRLKMNNVETVEDFLFMHSVDPQGLKKIISPRNDDSWKAMVDHAKTCNIDDKRVFEYSDSSEQNMRVVFDVVGELQGVIHDDHLILIDHVPEAEKGRAMKLMCLAFENRKGKTITPYNSIKTLVSQFPFRASYEAPNQPIQQSVPTGCNLTIPTSARQEFEWSNSAVQKTVNGAQDMIENMGIIGGGVAVSSARCFYAATNANHHCDTRVSGTTTQGACPSIRPSGEANNEDNALVIDSHNSMSLEQLFEGLSPSCFRSQGRRAQAPTSGECIRGVFNEPEPAPTYKESNAGVFGMVMNEAGQYIPNEFFNSTTYYK